MYKITIIEITNNVESTTEWQTLHDKKTFDNEKEPQYGYAKIDKRVKREVDIYEQVVENIELKDVIKAINSIT